MKIEKFPLGILGANCYLIINEDTKQAVLVDPGGTSKKFRAYIEEEGLKIEAVLLTHGHFDHIMGIDAVLEEHQVPVYVHEEDADIMTDPEMNLSSSYTRGYTFDGAQSVRDGQKLELAGYTFEVIHTPGHTMGCCCYYIQSEKVLFSGDTLFQCSVGRTDFANSSMSALVRSIRDRLFVLPEDTLVYPGHMGETKIGYEKLHNPYIQED